MNKKRYLGLASIVTVCVLLLLISGCGSSGNKEGTSGSGAASVAAVSQTTCTTCHSASLEKLTGYPIVVDYTVSIHNLNSVGCQDCHGNGGAHNGIGPIPYPEPGYAQCKSCHNSGTATNFALVTQYENSRHLVGTTTAQEPDKPCNRCHTHQGAVLAAISHFTGDRDVMDAEVGAPGDIAAADAQPIKCDTCHDTHQAQTLRVDSKWNPSTTVGAATVLTTNPDGTVVDNTASGQFRLCTQCHGYTTPAGVLMGSGTTASGTVKVGHHETSWYRIIGTTHFDNPTTQAIEGYVMRTNGPKNANPCFDCHGHEALTNSNNDPASASYKAANRTIYTDWAQSGHAGRILKVKYAAASSVTIPAGSRTDPARVAAQKAQVDAVMAAGALANIPANAGKEITPFTVDGEFEFWAQDGEFDCQRCHTSTGLVNFLSDVAGYKGEDGKNDYSHLIGWQRTRPTVPPNSSMQSEVLLCWGCHSNAGAGTLRTPGAITPESLPDAWYTFDGKQVTFPDVSGSNICVACHSGYKNRDGMVKSPRPDGRPNTRSNSFSPHYMNVAGSVFNEKAHMAYEFDIDANGNFAEHYTNVAYFAHDKIGLAAKPGTGSNGPCVACHMGGSSHTFSAATKDAAGVITAIPNQALCDSCHTGAYVMTAAKMEEEKADATEGLTVLNAYLSNTIANYRGVNLKALTRNDWRSTNPDGSYVYAEGEYGAFQNSLYPTKEEGAYVHNRIYVKRIIFDSIDWLDNGAFSGTITIDATAYPKAAAWFGAPAGTTGAYTAKRP